MALIGNNMDMEGVKGEEIKAFEGGERGALGEDRGALGEDRGVIGEYSGALGEDRRALGEDRGVSGDHSGALGEDRRALGEDSGVSGDYSGTLEKRKDHDLSKHSRESFDFVIPEMKKDLKSLQGEKNLNGRERRLKELFKVGNFIEVVYNQGSISEQTLVVFSISKILGMGGYGIVVLAEISSPNKKKSRSSVTVEINDPNMKQLLEKLEEELELDFDFELKEEKDRKSIGGMTRKLGKGAKKVVARGKKLAIKIMDLEANDSIELEDPLITARKEISIMSELQDCEQILEYYVTFASESFLYILMEYAEGGSLYGLYNKYGSFPEELIASVTQDILKALIRLHGQEENSKKIQNYILHNDIKSANILLTNKCVAKLADFGVSRKVKSDLKKNRGESDNMIDIYSFSNDQEVLGSPFWMAPEIILGNSFLKGEIVEKRIGEPGASDIWSLGITVLELAFGRIPWPNFESLEELLGYILSSSPPQKTVREDIKALFSQEFWDFVDSCLTKDPSSRKNANLLLKHPFILLKAKRPNSLNNFIQTISGEQQSHYSNHYFQSIFNYVNHFFSPNNKITNKFNSLSNQNFIKKISSVSISKYFSRKRSSIIQNSEKSQDYMHSKGFPPKDDKNEFSILDKKISTERLQKYLDIPSIEFQKNEVENLLFSPPNVTSSSTSPLKNVLSDHKTTLTKQEISNISKQNYKSFFGGKMFSKEKITQINNNQQEKYIENKEILSHNRNTLNSRESNLNKSDNNISKKSFKLKTRKFTFSCCSCQNAI